MHILMFLASTGRGGAESLVTNLCNQLAKTHNVTVLIFEESAWIDQLDPKINCVSLGRKKSRHNPVLYYSIRKAIQRIKPDLVHVHGAKAATIFSKLEKKLSFPVVATKHNSRKGKVFDEMEHVVAVSGEVASTVCHQATVIYNGIDASDSIVPDLQEDEFRILAIGRLDRIKGFDVLVSAMQKLPDKAVLQIAGEGKEREALQKLVQELKLEKRVKLLGFRDDVRNLMSQAHVVVIASHSEGFSLVLVESFFYANLLLSTKVGGAEEVLSEPLLFDHGETSDKIKAVMDNYEKYKELFSVCRLKHAEHFTVEKMADSYEKYYFQVLRAWSENQGY